LTIDLKISSDLSKQQKYESLLPQIHALIEDEKNALANLANITSALKYSMDNFLWVGFYFKDRSSIADELVLGPFQGRIACTRIKFGIGVCGSAAVRRETIIVPDVEKFPGHIFCDALSKSEIVVPVLKNGDIVAVLDIDSGIADNFDDTDKVYLEELVRNILHLF